MAGSEVARRKPHAVCVPYPSQGHIVPVLKLAKVLHLRGFYITFVNTEFNHQRLVKARGADALKAVDGFQFKTIPDGLPQSKPDATQDIPTLSASITKNCAVPFTNLIKDLNSSSDCPPVTCIVADAVMSITLEAAEELNIPLVAFYTTSACGFLAYFYYEDLVARGYVPFKDESYFTNGYLETEIDWIPGMKGIRLRDFPSFIRTTDPNAIMVHYNIVQCRNISRANAIIVNTYEELEVTVLEAIRTKYDKVYTIGPVHLLEKELLEKEEVHSLGASLWKEDGGCLEWLDQRESNSVLYVNFGSITVMTVEQLREFAWGLADSKRSFLWIIRPDAVSGESAVLSEEFLEEVKGRSMLARWCQQDRVLAHPSIGGYLTHSGWNSTIESLSEGVPMICWPFFAEQQTNCRYSCTEWGVGMEIENDVKREKVKELVKELMEGEKGKEMRKKALEWKEKAKKALAPGGSSYQSLDKVINEILLSNY